MTDLNYDDEEELMKIALEDPNSCRALHAINHIYNQEFLVGFIQTHYDLHISSLAAHNIEDDNILCNLYLESTSEGFCYEALKIINDQEFLHFVATKDISKQLRVEAFNRITDEQYLKDFISHDNFEIRKKAIESISDENIIKNFIIDEYIRSYSSDIEQAEIISLINNLLDKIDDNQLMLYDIAKSLISKNYRSCCYEVVNRITNEDILKEIVQNTDYAPSIRANAIGKINDNDFLKVIFNINKKSNYIRGKVIYRISDANFLKEVAISKDYNYSLRRKAYDKIKNEPYLSEINYNLVPKLKLDGVANIPMSYYKLSNKKIKELKDQVKDESLDMDVRIEALSLIYDSKFLEKLYYSSTEKPIFIQAEKQLKELGYEI